MSETDIQRAIDLVKSARARVQQAEIEKGVHEQAVQRLRPKRDAYVQSCQEKFGCSIADLPQILTQEEGEFVAGAESLHRAIESAVKS